MADEMTVPGEDAPDVAPAADAAPSSPPPTDPPPTDPPPVVVPKRSKYADAIEQDVGSQRALLASSVAAGTGMDPARHAKVLALAEHTGMPPEAVDANFDALSQQVKVQGIDYLHLMQHHPELAGWLSDKNNVAIAQDDIPTLRHLDMAMRSLAGEDATGILPPGFKFNPDGSITGRAVYGQAQVYRTIDDLRQSFQRQNEAAGIQDLDNQAAAARLRDDYGFGANVAAGFQASGGGTALALQRTIGRLFPGDRQRIADLHEGIAKISAASNELSPDAWGDIQRGVGGLAADLPLMLAGGPIAKAADSMLAARGASGILAPIARSKYLTEAFKVAAFMQPVAIKGGINSGADNGVAYGLTDWAINSAVPAAFGRTGLAHAIVPGAEAAAADGYMGAAKRMLMDGGFQATNNATVDLASAIHDYASGVDPHALDPDVLMRRLAVAGALGGIAGSVFNAPHLARDVHQRRVLAANGAIDFADRLGSAVELAAGSLAGEHSPERLQQLLQKFTPEHAGTVYFQGGEWADAWKAAGADPQAMADAMGVGKAFREAMATGAEMGVPTAELVRHAADAARNGKDPTELLMRARQVAGGSNAQEGVTFHQGAKEETDALMAEMQAEAKKAAKDVVEGDPIYEHKLEQAIQGGGRSREEAVQHAKLETAIFRTLAKRAGVDADAEYERYRLTITQETPAALQAGKVAVLDTLINRIRSGNVPSKEAVHGESLLPFLRRKGLQDVGGDLRSMDLDRELKPGQKAMVNPEGLGLDMAAQRAHAEGYIPDDDPNTLLAAIHAENQGVPVYRSHVADAAQGDIRAGLDELAARIHAAGVDLGNEPSNEVVKAALGDTGAAKALDVAQRFEQGIAPANAFLTFPNLLKQWKKAHGDRSPTPGDKDWDKLVRQARMVDESNGKRYEQPARGSITVNAARQFAIALGKGADLSTLAHESAHFYLEVLGDFSERETAEASLKADYQAVLDWLGVKDRASIGIEQHEQFARGWEAYLYEGKAPSVELRGVFARFAIWMAHVYKSIKALAVNLTPEVRSVFDRMLASVEAIEAAKADMPEGDAAFKAIMSPAEFEKYRANKIKATADAQDKVFQKAMAVVRREQTKEWKAELAKELEAITPAIARRPVYVAENALRRGKDPDGKDLPSPVKLDKREILREYGKDGTTKLPRGVTSDEDGALSLQAAADLFGFRTGDELWTALANIQPREAVIRAEAEANVKARRPDLMSDGTMAEAAMAAVHTKVRGDVLNAEALALAVKAGRRAVPMDQIRRVAKRLIDEQPAGKITPNLYLRAERRYGRESFDLLNQEKHSEALDAKKQEMLNFALFEAAAEAKDTISKGIEFLKRMTKPAAQERLGKAGGHTWAVRSQDGTLLKAFDNEMDAEEFGQTQGAEVKREGGFLPAMNEIVAQLRSGWKEMPYAQAAALMDIAKSIEHQASNAFQLRRIAERQDVEQAIAELSRTAEENGTVRKRNASPTNWDGVVRFLENADALHTKLSFIARRIDGFKEGGRFWEMFVRPVNEAADAETERKTASTVHLNDLFKAWGKGGVGKANVYTPRYFRAINDKISHMGRIMVALNWGATPNRERIVNKNGGHGWEDGQVQAILDTLDEADWGLVKGIWAHIQSFWPEIQAQEERLRGVPPEAKETLPIQTKFGIIQGGYFPIKYDAEASARTSDELTTDKMMAGKVVASNRGYTKATVESTGRRISLKESVISQHLGEVIHRLTHEDVLADIRKLINNKALQQTIVERFGMNAYRVIRDTMGDIAQGEQRAQGALEQAARHLRTGVSSATMGFNLSSAAMQITGVTQSIHRVGWKYFAIGAKRMGSDAVSMESSAAWIQAKSSMMRNRANTFHRDIKDNLDGIGARKLLNPIRRNLFYMMQKMQQLVDMPTWIGAYEKALAEHPSDEAKAIALADQTVLDTQGGGQTKDLAKAQRGNEFMRLFTVFYHFFNTTYNLGSEAIRSKDYRNPVDVAKLGVDFLMLVSAPVALTAALKAATRGTAREGDDPKEWAKKLAADHLQYLLSTMILGRELSGGTDGFSYQGPAGTRGLGALSDLVGGAFGKVGDSKAEKSAAVALGILFHLPAVQVQRMIEGYQWSQENHVNPAVPLLFGKPFQP